MLNASTSRRPRVLIGRGGLSKCIKCGVAFVAKHPAHQTCSKCSGTRGQRSDGYPTADQSAKRPRNYGGT